MKDRDLVSANAIECDGVLSIEDMKDDKSSTGMIVPLNLLANKDGFEPLKLTSAQIQHFRDGTTRVLCPYIDNGFCTKKRAYNSSDDDGNDLLNAIPEGMKYPDFFVNDDVTCPYKVS